MKGLIYSFSENILLQAEDGTGPLVTSDCKERSFGCSCSSTGCGVAGAPAYTDHMACLLVKHYASNVLLPAAVSRICMRWCRHLFLLPCLLQGSTCESFRSSGHPGLLLHILGDLLRYLRFLTLLFPFDCLFLGSLPESTRVGVPGPFSTQMGCACCIAFVASHLDTLSCRFVSFTSESQLW